MLAQTSQIRMTLTALEHNIKILLREREQFEKEFKRLTQENEELKKELNGYKENSSKPSSEVSSNDIG
jgi:cell division septum initiation protein DivIVA